MIVGVTNDAFDLNGDDWGWIYDLIITASGFYFQTDDGIKVKFGHNGVVLWAMEIGDEANALSLDPLESYLIAIGQDSSSN